MSISNNSVSYRPPRQQSDTGFSPSPASETATSHRPSPALIAGGQLVIKAEADRKHRRVTAPKAIPKQAHAEAPKPTYTFRQSDILARMGWEIAHNGGDDDRTMVVKYWPKDSVLPRALLVVRYPAGTVHPWATIRAGTIRVPRARATPPRQQPVIQTRETTAPPVPGPRARRGSDAGLEHLSDAARLQPLPAGDKG
ncbi:hypothetical protein ACUSIJ_02370 [Pseudochelatococcus sp. B33]